MSDLRTCRFCGMSNYEHHHAAARSAWVKYGPRHQAHLKCAIDKQGADFLRRLPRFKLETLPVLEIHALGMDAVFYELLGVARPNAADERTTRPESAASQNSNANEVYQRGLNIIKGDPKESL